MCFIEVIEGGGVVLEYIIMRGISNIFPSLLKMNKWGKKKTKTNNKLDLYNFRVKFFALIIYTYYLLPRWLER